MSKDFSGWSEERARRLLDAVSIEERQEQRPLPSALAERLRAIPRQEISCDAVERLYLSSLGLAEDTETSAPAAGDPAAGDPAAGDPAASDPAAERHLASCPRCRRLYAPLGAFAPRPRRKVPPRLAERLRAIPRRPRPAWWVRDSRYAAAVCLLTAGLLTATGSLQADQLIDATRGAGQRTGEWIANGRQEGAGITQQLDSRFDVALAMGQGWLRATGAVWGSFVETTEEQMRRLPAMLDVELSPNEGESDGSEDRNPSRPAEP